MAEDTFMQARKDCLKRRGRTSRRSKNMTPLRRRLRWHCEWNPCGVTGHLHNRRRMTVGFLVATPFV
jgi:hypothetical protein